MSENKYYEVLRRISFRKGEIGLFLSCFPNSGILTSSNSHYTIIKRKEVKFSTIYLNAKMKKGDRHFYVEPHYEEYQDVVEKDQWLDSWPNKNLSPVCYLNYSFAWGVQRQKIVDDHERWTIKYADAKRKIGKSITFYGN